MGERELMKLRELKEAAHALFARGRYAQCAETYERILRLAPKDPNVRVRHAESCRRAGDRQSAITSYRAAAELLLEQGCESRARGALRAALELDPRDPTILADLARLAQQAPSPQVPEEERPAPSAFERTPVPAAHARTPAPPRAQVVPPPSPPSYILRAAEETPRPGALPAVPHVAPLMPPMNPGNIVPSITPVIQGRLITQPPVPPALPGPGMRPALPGTPRPPGMMPSVGRPAGAPAQAASPLTMVPIPRAGGDARAAAQPVMPYRPELRRLGPNAVALRVSPNARWVIIRSDSPLEVSRAETLPVPGEPQAGAAYAAAPSHASPASSSH